MGMIETEGCTPGFPFFLCPNARSGLKTVDGLKTIGLLC